MGAKVDNPKNNLEKPDQEVQAEEVIEYEGYEEFPIIEIAKNSVMKTEKVRPNPSLNNHSGGSSIGKYESENAVNKYKDKIEGNEEENNKIKDESKFKKEQTEKKDEENNINNENNNIIIHNVEEIQENEKVDAKGDILKSNNNVNTVEINLEEKKPEEIDMNNGGEQINDNEIYGNINNDNINDRLNNGISEIKEEDATNENEEKEKINTENNINNIDITEEKKVTNEEIKKGLEEKNQITIGKILKEIKKVNGNDITNHLYIGDLMKSHNNFNNEINKDENIDNTIRNRNNKLYQSNIIWNSKTNRENKKEFDENNTKNEVGNYQKRVRFHRQINSDINNVNNLNTKNNLYREREREVNDKNYPYNSLKRSTQIPGRYHLTYRQDYP
jgi:hypothetical protein